MAFRRQCLLTATLLLGFLTVAEKPALAQSSVAVGNNTGVVVNTDVLNSLGAGSSVPSLTVQPGTAVPSSQPLDPSGLLLTRPGTLLFPPPSNPVSRLAQPSTATAGVAPQLQPLQPTTVIGGQSGTVTSAESPQSRLLIPVQPAAPAAPVPAPAPQTAVLQAPPPEPLQSTPVPVQPQAVQPQVVQPQVVQPQVVQPQAVQPQVVQPQVVQPQAVQPQVVQPQVVQPQPAQPQMAESDPDDTPAPEVEATAEAPPLPEPAPLPPPPPEPEPATETASSAIPDPPSPAPAVPAPAAPEPQAEAESGDLPQPPPVPDSAETEVATAETGESAPQSAALPPPSTEAAGDTVSILFEAGSAELSDAGRSNLKTLAENLLRDEESRVQLLAYASSDGSSANVARRLSLSRALVVRGYLIDQGIPSTRMQVRALGDRSEDGPQDRVDIKPQGG